jgi:hypothetical protein
VPSRGDNAKLVPGNAGGHKTLPYDVGGEKGTGARIVTLAPFPCCYDFDVQLIIQRVPNLSLSEPK